MSMMLVFTSVISSFISFRTWAWVVTSRAVVGSSATRSFGRCESAMAIITLWRMPPERLERVPLEDLLGVGDPDQLRASTASFLSSGRELPLRLDGLGALLPARLVEVLYRLGVGDVGSEPTCSPG